MKILAIDTSGKAVSAAVFENELKSEALFIGEQNHSEKLFELVDKALMDAGCKIEEIDLFAVSAGPGSFTGLRIGISSVKGLSFALNKPCAAVSSLDALSMNIKGGFVCPIMDARRGEIYAAGYLDNKNLIEPCAVPLNDFLGKVKAVNRTPVFLGDGVPVHRDAIISAIPGAEFAAEESFFQRAQGVARIAAQMDSSKYVSGFELVPNYMRVPQAERLLKEKKA